MQVMETRNRALGLEHPDTLTSMNNLACAFGSLDMKKEAIPLMNEWRQKKLPLIIPELSNQYRDCMNGGIRIKLDVCSDG